MEIPKPPTRVEPKISDEELIERLKKVIAELEVKNYEGADEDSINKLDFLMQEIK